MKIKGLVERMLIFVAGMVVAYGLCNSNSSIFVVGNVMLFVAYLLREEK